MNPKTLISLSVMLLAATSPLTSLEWRNSWGMLPLLAQTTEDRKAEADRLSDQGIQQYYRSQYGEAIKSWQQALKIYQEIANRQGEANSYGNLGIVYNNLGQYETAISYYEKSLAIYTEIGDRNGDRCKFK